MTAIHSACTLRHVKIHDFCRWTFAPSAKIIFVDGISIFAGAVYSHPPMKMFSAKKKAPPTRRCLRPPSSHAAAVGHDNEEDDHQVDQEDDHTSRRIHCPRAPPPQSSSRSSGTRCWNPPVCPRRCQIWKEGRGAVPGCAATLRQPPPVAAALPTVDPFYTLNFFQVDLLRYRLRKYICKPSFNSERPNCLEKNTLSERKLVFLGVNRLSSRVRRGVTRITSISLAVIRITTTLRGIRVIFFLYATDVTVVTRVQSRGQPGCGGNSTDGARGRFGE